MSDNYIKGLDISAIQGIVDYEQLKKNGIEFCIFRCFVGNSDKDHLYDQNVIKATAAGIKVACYHFVYPLPPLSSQPTRDPKIQAKMHVAAAGNVSVVCCDLEWPPVQDWGKWNCNGIQIVEWATTYLEEYERLSGIRPIVYTYPNFADNIHLSDSFAQKYKLWIASYTATPRIPKPWTDWVMWQNSGGSQKLPNGVPVDTDLAKDLSLWDTLSVETPPATTEPEPIIVPEPLPEPVAPITPDLTVVPPLMNNSTVNIFVLLWQFIMRLFSKKS